MLYPDQVGGTYMTLLMTLMNLGRMWAASFSLWFLDQVMCCTVQYCTVLYCTVLYCTALYCTGHST